MVRLNIPLDPGKTGREAFSLENSLRRMIVGQDEAIQQIVNIYQMNLTGMSAPGRPIGQVDVVDAAVVEGAAVEDASCAGADAVATQARA